MGPPAPIANIRAALMRWFFGGFTLRDGNVLAAVTQERQMARRSRPVGDVRRVDRERTLNGYQLVECKARLGTSVVDQSLPLPPSKRRFALLKVHVVSWSANPSLSGTFNSSIAASACGGFWDKSHSASAL